MAGSQRRTADAKPVSSSVTADQRDAILKANAELLSLNADIRRFEHWGRIARRRRRFAYLIYLLLPILSVALYVMFWLPWISQKALTALALPGFFAVTVLSIAAFSLYRNPGGGPKVAVEGEKSSSGYPVERRRTEGEIELIVAKTRDTRKLKVADGVFDQATRRLIYKDEAYMEIERFRGESKRYRNVNNALQGTLIIGSIGATGSSGISAFGGPIRWVVLGLSLAVGIASGFMGYYKYKERSFYLQQTADAIEHEWEAFEVGVGRYKYCDTEEIALREFVEEIHRLKSEQRKREQNLEQPPETRNSGELQ